MPLINVNPQVSQSNKQINQLSSDLPLQQAVQFSQTQEGIRSYETSSTEQIVQKNINEMFEKGVERIQQSQNDNIVQIPQQVPQNQSPVTQSLSLDHILMQAIQQGASDIHLSVGYRAFLRVNGVLIQISTPILTNQILHTFAETIISQRKDIDLEKIYQVDLSYGFNNVRFRVNIFKKSGLLSIVMRLIPTEIKSIEELGLPSVFYDFTKAPGGLILVTGPTGSGKSTTIAALINYINFNLKRHIITVEDPIEFIYPKALSIINQREYGIDFESWPNALKSILRQDPDIVLVGEMRDFETIASAITISETGHLVFATLHTNSAAQSIDRIIDVFPEGQQPQVRAQLANTLTAVISQRLAPLTMGGRKAVHEVMIANPAIKNSIREGKIYQIDNMIQTGQDSGMISMEQSLVNLIKEGKITVETAQSLSVKPRELEILLNK